MTSLTPSQTLEYNIALLEIKKEEDWIALKSQFEHTKELLTPGNLLKSALGIGGEPDNETSSAIKSGLSKAAIGMASGYVLKKLLFHTATKNPLVGLASMAFQTAATGFVAKNSDKIKSTADKVFGFFKSKLLK